MAQSNIEAFVVILRRGAKLAEVYYNLLIKHKADTYRFIAISSSWLGWVCEAAFEFELSGELAVLRGCGHHESMLRMVETTWHERRRRLIISARGVFKSGRRS